MPLRRHPRARPETGRSPFNYVRAGVAILVGATCSVIASTAKEPNYTDTPLAGLLGEPGHLDGQGSLARVNRTRFGCLDGAGNLYISESGTIRRISPNGEVRTLAGAANLYRYLDGVGAEARFSEFEFPIAADRTGNVYAVDPIRHTVRKITSRGEVTTFAGK